MAARFRPFINQAAAAVPILQTSMLWKTPDAIAKLLGLRFLAMVPANKNPCLQSCASSNCQFMHKLTPTPAPDIVMGIQAHVKA
jgi:hypothetical protein